MYIFPTKEPEAEMLLSPRAMKTSARFVGKNQNADNRMESVRT